MQLNHSPIEYYLVHFSPSVFRNAATVNFEKDQLDIKRKVLTRIGENVLLMMSFKLVTPATMASVGNGLSVVHDSRAV